MTIGQLYVEAESRWDEIWDEKAARMLILLMFPRNHRKMMELHGDMVEHGQPVMTVFHRPRDEAKLLEDQGFDSRSASFQFVDIASFDLGPWMQHLIGQEKWLRGTINVMPVPFSMGLPAQRPFEMMNVLCFRHPEVKELDNYYLPFPPNSIPGKCFVSLPRRQAAELARQQAEVLGVGRLVKKSQITIQESPVDALPPQIKTEEEAQLDAVLDNFSEQMMEDITAQVEEVVNVKLPSDIVKEIPIVDEVELPQAPIAVDNVEIPVIEEEEEIVEMSDVEIEFRALVTELIEAGVEPSDMMDDPRWEDISERAMATGFETWPVFLQLTAMQ
ncbi:MAG: hypothetical protein VYC12_06905 [Candidatus Thermoplasmatota archaeon]|nr:hypothetical protein [Candidatus Thermoplasmatota archaeon]